MRITDPVGIHHQMDTLDPAVIREQRLQELKDVAEWRFRKMQKYRDWVDPEVIAQRKTNHEFMAKEALERGKRMAALAREQQRNNIELPNGPSLERIGIKIKPINKTTPKLVWWKRLLLWMFQ